MKRNLLISLIFLALTPISCTQEEGDRCERTEDCDEGLVCCIRVGENEGTCQLPENCTTGMSEDLTSQSDQDRGEQ